MFNTGNITVYTGNGMTVSAASHYELLGQVRHGLLNRRLVYRSTIDIGS